METEDWQSWAAIAVVILTMAAFVWRPLRSRKRKDPASGCGGGCDCKPDGLITGSHQPEK